MIKVMFKWTKWLSMSALSLLLLLTLFIAILLFTNSGLKLTVWGAQKALPQLSVESTEGSLFPRFSLNNVRFVDDSLHIDAQLQQLTLAVKAQCFFDPSLCIDEIALQGLSLNLSELLPSSSEEPSKEPLTSIAVPLPINIKRIELLDIDLNILGNQVDWQHFSTSLSMQGDRLSIGRTRLETINVQLAKGHEDNPVEPKAESAEKVKSEADKTAIKLPEVWIPLKVDLKRFDLSSFTLIQDSPLNVTHLGLEAKAGEYSVVLNTLELDMPQIKASAQAEVELKEDYPLNLTLDALLKETELKGQKLSLDASGSVGELTFSSQFSGVIDALLSGDIKPLESTLPFDLRLSEGKAQWPLSGKSDYQVTIDQLKTQGSLEGYSLLLDTQISGKDIPEMKVNLNGKGTLSQIDLDSIAIKTLGGELGGKVMANWTSPINWKADLSFSDIKPGLQWKEAEGVISGKLATSGSLTAEGGWKVELPSLNVDGVLRDYPLNIVGQLKASDVTGKGAFKVQTDGLALSHGPNSINAKGLLDKNWQMDVQLNFPSFAKSLPELSGNMQGDLKLRGALKEPEIELDINVDNVQWQQQMGLQHLSLSGRVKPLPQPKADIQLLARHLSYEDKLVDSVKLDLSGTQDAHQLVLDVASNIVSTSLALSGSFNDKPKMEWSGVLQRVLVSSEQGPWELDHAVKLGFDIDNKQASVQAHCWTQSKSKVCLTKDMQAGESGEASLAIQQFDFEQVKQFIPEKTEVDGKVNATAWAKWAPEKAPELTVEVEMPKGQVTQTLEQPIVVGWDSIGLQMALKDNQLQAKWLLDMTDNGDISGHLALPDVQAEDKLVDAELNLSTFNLDFLQPLVGDYSLLKANLETNLALSGPLMHPQVKGKLIVDDMVLKGDVSPIDVNSGRLAIDFMGYQAKLDADIITPDGDLNIAGTGDWQDLKDWHTNIRVFAEQLKVDMPPMVKIKLVPDMTIDVSPKLAKITGSIALPWGRIVVEELPQSAVGISKDQVILNKDLQPVDEATPIPFDVETDINISIGDDFLLSAFGLEGGLIGQLNVAQKDKGPFVTGEINIANGSYRSFGQDLLIKQGKILMNGPVDEPYVSIKAIRNPDNTQDKVTAGVKVSGPASEPVVEIFSDPAMPQANALSYLLRGQNIDGESGGNAMTTTLIGLSLAKSGQIVGELGEAFGVQDLQLDTAGSGDDSQVTVSGYILPGLQVKYGVGIFNSLGEFTVRYRLMQDLYVEAVSGLDSAVDLLYQFEFN
ncbi:translocation/assembly module TamB [Vibrio clamense]|uniref:autotransporter assembly complex protein TamB n=1 Tax=Vibrio clamense TaxID=2910254 RepID=UPI003D212BE9